MSASQSRKRKAGSINEHDDQKHIKSKFKEYADIYIKPALGKDEFGGKVINKFMLTEYKFEPLREKILGGQSDMMNLLDLLYQYFNTHGDENFAVLVGQCVPKDSTLDYFGPKNSIGQGVFPRHIPEDTIYFHLLATIYMNIEFLFTKYDGFENGLDFLNNNLLTKAMEENSLTGKYLMLENEYKSLFGNFGEQKKKFDLGVPIVKPFDNLDSDSARIFNEHNLDVSKWKKLQFNELSNTSLGNGIELLIRQGSIKPSDENLYNGESMKQGSVMKASRSKNSKRPEPYTTTNPNKSNQSTKPDCPHWKKCYRLGNPAHTEKYNHPLGGGGRRTRKYGRKTRTKKNLRKSKTHKKRKTRRGRK